MQSKNLDEIQNYRRDQISIFIGNDGESRYPNNPSLFQSPTFEFQLWKSAVNIAKLLQNFRPADRTTFIKKVLIPNLSIKSFLDFESNCERLMKRNSILYNKFKRELSTVFQSEINLERGLINKIPEHNPPEDEISVHQVDRICTKCLRGENVTKCCTHCHRYFDEGCFASIHRNNNDPENLCPDCDEDDDVMEDIVQSCETCDGHLPQVDADNFRKCIFHKCSVLYHRECFPAGAKKLSGTQMICSKHNDPRFDSDKLKICRHCCAKGTSLIKCISCPLSFHSRKCLKIGSTKDKQIMCDVCQKGRVLLEGNQVFAWNEAKKIWWPAIIVSEKNVPENVLRQRKMNVRKRSGYFWIEFHEIRTFQWKHQSDVLTPNQMNDDFSMSVRGRRANRNLDNAHAAADAA